MHRAAQEITAHLSEWERAHVEFAIYGTDSADVIAQALEDLCRREIHSPIDRILFYRSSIGAVAGLLLQNDRRVVVKAHQPDWSRERLAQIAALQTQIADELKWAPRIVAGPTALGRGFAIVEEYVDRGEWRDAHDPVVRRSLAGALHRLIEHLLPFVDSARLPSSLLASDQTASLWPTPHSRLFDFEATKTGAEYIDALAAEARSLMSPAGRTVLGHSDWRVEHVRFAGTEVAAAFDWDSLTREREPALVGMTAHMFCGDWSREFHVQAPSLEEARGFVADYESAMGRVFTNEERRLCGAAFAYAVAYTSRCGHACGVDSRSEPGTFQHLIGRHGSKLLQL